MTGNYEFFDEIDEDDEEEYDALYDFAMELRHSRYSEREPYRARGGEDLCTRMLFGKSYMNDKEFLEKPLLNC